MAEQKEKVSKKIMELAKTYGLEKDHFFVSTLDRYETQVKVAADLKASINKVGTLVTKEYVKGRQNICINPAITEYNKTTDSANKTVQTLVKIIKSLGTTKTSNEDNPLFRALSGDFDEDN